MRCPVLLAAIRFAAGKKLNGGWCLMVSRELATTRFRRIKRFQILPMDSYRPMVMLLIPEAEVAFSFQQVSDDDGNDGNSLELKSGPINMPNVGIVHGPALQSAHTYNLEVGDVLSFDWRGVAGAGDYDVMAYIVDESTGHTEELLNATGQGTASSSWATVSKTIEKDGDYRVVFVSGVRSDKEVTFENGTFENGAAGDTSIPGWTAYTQQVRLGGLDTVAGQPTPGDTVFPATVVNAAPHDGATPSNATYTAKLSNNSADGNGLSVQLQSTGVTVQGFGILHGPYLVSNEAITLKPGDSVSFDWQATGGSDAYDVIGYLVDETTGEVQELLNETGATTSASTNWATVTQAVSKQGSYKFVFVAGTWDASGGTAAGANLYVDNVVVDSSEQIVQADVALRIDEVVITKDTANIDKQELNKLIDRLYGFEEDGGRALRSAAHRKSHRDRLKTHRSPIGKRKFYRYTNKCRCQFRADYFRSGTGFFRSSASGC